MSALGHKRYDASAFLTLRVVLPILPVHVVVVFQVTGNGCAKGREKVILPELREQFKSLQLILYRILQLGKTELDTLRLQTSHFAPVVCATSSKSGSFQFQLR